MTKEYVSHTRRKIDYLASLNGKIMNGETYAHSFSEVKSQLEEIYINVDLINIQFKD